MQIRKELWFGFILMGIILASVVGMVVSVDTMTNGHYGLLMLSLVVVAIGAGTHKDGAVAHLLGDDEAEHIVIELRGPLRIADIEHGMVESLHLEHRRFLSLMPAWSLIVPP